MISKNDTTTTVTSIPGGKKSLRLRATWISLFNFTTKKHVPTLTLAIVFALGAGITMPAMAVILGSTFDVFTSFTSGTLLGEDLLGKIVKYCIQMVGLGAISWFLSGAYFTLFTAFGELQAGNARSRLFVELLRRDVEWFQLQQDGTGAFLSSVQA